MKRWNNLLMVVLSALVGLLPRVVEAQSCGTANGQVTTSNFPVSCDPGLPSTHPVSGSATYNVSGSTTCSGTAFGEPGAGGWAPATQQGNQNVTVNASGQCGCVPSVLSSTTANHDEHIDYKIPYRTNCATPQGGSCGCVNQETVHHVYTAASTCTGSFCCSTHSVCEGGGNRWDGQTCTCMFSPLMLVLEGSYLGLSSASQGVLFDLSPGPPLERVAWPTQPNIVPFVVDDRNGNGTIDDGGELIGSASPQGNGSERNGFNALALYDTDADGVVSRNDVRFNDSKLWFDLNRDGVTQRRELVTLSDAGVVGLSLRYQTLDRRDEWGNVIAYRSRAFIRNRNGGMQSVWLYDPVLRTEPAESTTGQHR